MHARIMTLGCFVLLGACSASPAPTDAGSTADVPGVVDTGVGIDAGVPIDAMLTDTPTAVDTGVAVDTGGGGATCGTMTCTPAEVCCAATGPGGDMCRAPAACTLVRCDGPEDCTGGTLCCTDGIQSVCEDATSCFERSCRTAADCDTAEVCCPFGDMQQACRTSC